MAIKRPHIGKEGWKAPPVGSSAREDLPAHVFLNPSQRKYPYKVYRNGKWEISYRGIMAAYRRAIMQGDRAIRDKAKRILNRLRKEKGLEPLE